MRKWNVIRSIAEAGIVAVVRAQGVEQAKEISDACAKGGISSIEVTYTVPGASEVIRALKERDKGHQLIVGAGTVLDAETARIAILAGADFVVGPSFDAETAKLCNRYGVPYLPGCMTIAEMIHALEFGCDVIKLFPGSAFGPTFVKDVKGPLPQLNLMPTGGVSLENVQDWIRNGAVAVGVGGQLIKGTPRKITETAKQFVAKISEVRKEVGR
ncbi:bifunctional 2-keto-4-hydroxyglutarate aldolase/2-keto-3-deoxy-6-phosphogluconate aldolase [Alicyclobacillus mengziensis]|uniref:Bifunctional 2-keto-4-hydroxyglutarate aldolase/2-keto-3-deoxy-6-phosphogluconate aldolase n=1 Tax=Alicyclobacillus mengziensis TaxID=2931921 RepID=A0A9X7Z5R1_9BACL|nr:bifunctional 2-keto-4-hydroxyglutarate aldolase/2-keto-3-deoxy-6-phosphogluconate aldolase [Alicyclobacillus mengziensis]QSO46607.1 bifunctional 2-keto-4-hydroxyglutarate aldolase/2-keto-3-deoxy-6-phosphogluconate aldolase [Alicyclobacillus mengziensis]